MTQHDAIIRAIEIAGSQTALAAKIGATKQQVNHWIMGRAPVPAARCRAIEAATGVSVYDLCPQVFGPPPQLALAKAAETGDDT